MTNVKAHAIRELRIVKENTPDALLLEFEKEIIALCEAFGKSGQSGGSAPYVADAVTSVLKKLMLFETISPLTGGENEWTDITQMNNGETMYQNNRNSAVFKYGEGRCVYVDAIVKRTQTGRCWVGRFWKSKEDYLSGDRTKMVSNSQYIKSFPFTPKTFYIDVIEEEVAPDDWEMWLKDPKQLDEIFEYYDEYKTV